MPIPKKKPTKPLTLKLPQASLQPPQAYLRQNPLDTYADLNFALTTASSIAHKLIGDRNRHGSLHAILSKLRAAEQCAQELLKSEEAE